MASSQSDSQSAFLKSAAKHILMLSTHGLHQWQIIPGLPDTGGQNVFVNQFSQALADEGFRITIANRGGFRHPRSGRWQRGVNYKDSQQRILYLEDGLPEFVRKEEMGERIPYLVKNLHDQLKGEGTTVELIFSHYWDAGTVGEHYRRQFPSPPLHYWIPHSLGRIKRRNVSEDQYMNLRIDERIAYEEDLLKRVDGVIGTSTAIRTSLQQSYGFRGKVPFLPPCIDTDRFAPHEVADHAEIWAVLSRDSELPAREIRNRRIISEISRTDRTKRKEILIRSFAKIQEKHPDTFLVISIDEHKADLAGGLIRLINRLDIRPTTAIVGPIYRALPDLFAVTDIYCTPSIMEGFGMSAQEAAATGVPIIASTMVPFAKEYLLGEDPEVIFNVDFMQEPITIGEGAILVEPDNVQDFVAAIDLLLSDDSLRERMGSSAFDITIPYFTWGERVQDMLSAIAI